jgi:hypothetical protein
MTTIAQRTVWKHNSFFGHVRMMEGQLLMMYKADTTTPETKATAAEISKLLKHLARSLKTRA